MPRLPDRVLKVTFYLYRNYEEAQEGSKYGGTGFLVSIPSIKFPDKICYHYGITNWHNALQDGFSVIRQHTLDGKTVILDFGPEDWEFIPRQDDIAVIPINMGYKSKLIPIDIFATDDVIERNRIGIGDNQ